MRNGHQPEVDYITDAQVDRIASATSQAYATPEDVHETTGLPGPIEGVSPFRLPIRLIG